MSLSSILSYNNKQYQEFRTLLEDLFPTPKFIGEATIKVEPRTKNYALIGIAFDYLLRFSLGKKYKSFIHGSTWVSEEAMNYFQEGNFITSGNPDNIDFDNIHSLMKKKDQENKRVRDKFEKCKKICEDFTNTPIGVSDSLLEASLFLSRLDLIVRAPYKIELNLEAENKEDLNDLRLLLKNCNLDQFKPKEKIILNPTFGKGSKLVGGADADLIIDNTLIDIKTTKEQKITRPIFNQLLGYYLIYLIGGIDNHDNVRVENLGLYFSRYGVLWSMPVKEIGSNDDFKKAVNKLKNK